MNRRRASLTWTGEKEMRIMEMPMMIGRRGTQAILMKMASKGGMVSPRNTSKCAHQRTAGRGLSRVSAAEIGVRTVGIGKGMDRRTTRMSELVVR